MALPNDIKRRLGKAEDVHAARTGKRDYAVISHLGETPEPGKRWLIVTGVPKPDQNAPELRGIQQRPAADPWRGTPFASQNISPDAPAATAPDPAPAPPAAAPAAPVPQQLQGIEEHLRELTHRDESKPFDINGYDPMAHRR